MNNSDCDQNLTDVRLGRPRLRLDTAPPVGDATITTSIMVLMDSMPHVKEYTQEMSRDMEDSRMTG